MVSAELLERLSLMLIKLQGNICGESFLTRLGSSNSLVASTKASENWATRHFSRLALVGHVNYLSKTILLCRWQRKLSSSIECFLNLSRCVLEVSDVPLAVLPKTYQGRYPEQGWGVPRKPPVC